jgi:hypothetical protein
MSEYMSEYMMKTTRIYIYISEDVLEDMPEVSPGKCQNMSESVRKLCPNIV